MSNILSKATKPFKSLSFNDTPKGRGYGSGWCGEIDKAWVNGYYAVMSRDIDTEWGRVTHYFIRNVSNTDISWADKQIIKNKLAGYDKTAIEVFPSQANLIDEAGAYHLWVLHDIKLPFGLHNSDMANMQHNQNNLPKQEKGFDIMQNDDSISSSTMEVKC